MEKVRHWVGGRVGSPEARGEGGGTRMRGALRPGGGGDSDAGGMTKDDFKYEVPST